MKVLTSNTRHRNAVRRGATTVEIAVMIFIAALVALVIYKIATRVTNNASDNVDTVIDGSGVDGKKMKAIE